MLQRILYTAPLLALLALGTANANAQDLIVNDKGKNSTVSGVITDIDSESFTLSVNDDTRVKVDIDDLEIEEGHFHDLFKTGDRVEVEGDFDDGELEADRIVKITEDEGFLFSD